VVIVGRENELLQLIFNDMAEMTMSMKSVGGEVTVSEKNLLFLYPGAITRCEGWM
jgi:hypothetical protein